MTVDEDPMRRARALRRELAEQLRLPNGTNQSKWRTVAIAASIAGAITFVLITMAAWQPSPGNSAGAQTAAFSGGEFAHDTSRYALGSGSDEVVLGRWDCVTETPALLRAYDGTVWTFSQWPGGKRETAGRLVPLSEPATRIAGQREGNCDVLVVTGQSGRTFTTSSRR